MSTYTTYVNGGSIEIVVPDDNADGTEYSNLNQTTDTQIQTYSNTLDFVSLIKNIDSIQIQDDGNGGITLSSTNNVYEPIVTSETDTVTPIVNETDSTDSLLDLIRKDSQSITSANKSSLTAYENRSKLIEEQNKILAEQNKTFKELIQTVAISNASVVKQIEQLSNNIDIANGLKTGDLILKADNNRILSQKDMSTLVNNTNNVNVDTTPIAEQTAKIATATETLATGVNSQIETNTKINEKLDFEKNGADTLTDTDGNIIKPREVKAKNHAEHMIDKTKENQIDYSDLIPSDDDILTDDTNILQNAIKDFLSLDTEQLQTIIKADNNIKEDV